MFCWKNQYLTFWSQGDSVIGPPGSPGLPGPGPVFTDTNLTSCSCRLNWWVFIIRNTTDSHLLTGQKGDKGLPGEKSKHE